MTGFRRVAIGVGSMGRRRRTLGPRRPAHRRGAAVRLLRGRALRRRAPPRSPPRPPLPARIASTTRPTVVVERVAVRPEVDGVRRRPQRRDRPGRIELVAPPQLGQDLRRLGPAGVEAALLGPPPGPLLGRGVEEQLEVGVGQHDGPDVAAGHDDPAAVDEPALPLEERGAELRDARDRRHGHVDLGAADRGRGVLAVDRHVGEPAGLVGQQLDLVDERGRAPAGSPSPIPRRRASHVTAR